MLEHKRFASFRMLPKCNCKSCSVLLDCTANCCSNDGTEVALVSVAICKVCSRDVQENAAYFLFNTLSPAAADVGEVLVTAAACILPCWDL